MADNISRFEKTPDADCIIAAARAAGVHQLIVKLPEGYGTPVGEAGANLSAGQRRRRAGSCAYRDPFLVVLDEPIRISIAAERKRLLWRFSVYDPEEALLLSSHIGRVRSARSIIYLS